MTTQTRTLLYVGLRAHPVLFPIALLTYLVLQGVSWGLLLSKDLASPAEVWHATAYAGMLLAGFAAFVQGFMPMRDTLAALPVPVTTRQLHSIPFSISLFVVTIGVSLYLAAPAIAWLFGHPVAWGGLADGLVYALPVMAFFITTTNWASCTPYQNIPAFVYPLLLLGVGKSDEAGITIFAFLYPYPLAPVLILVSLVALWDAPRRVAMWQRAAFVTASWMGNYTWIQREYGAPRRLPVSSVCAEVLIHLANGAVMIFILVLIAPLNFVEGPTDSITSGPVARWLWIGATGALLLLFLFLCARAVYLGIQSYQLSTQSRFAQGFLIALAWYNRLVAFFWPDQAVPLYRCPRCGRYQPIWAPCCGGLPFPTSANPEWAQQLPPSVVRKRWGHRIAACVLAFGVTNQTMDVDVASTRIGAGIAGAPFAMLGGMEYDDEEVFSQHYVALRKADDARISEDAVQEAIEQLPPPNVWLDGLQTVNGAAPTVPDKYRIEIAQPQPDVLVIQAMALRWAPAGHLAYALAKHLQGVLESDIALELAPEYDYERTAPGPVVVYGFLDNNLHWVGAAGAAGEES